MSLSTRENILSIVAKIIATEGLDAVSIRYVCEKAGVKAPTVYYYFKDKDGLLQAVIGAAYKKHAKMYSDFVKGRSSIKALLKTWESFFEFVEKDPELFHAIVVAHLKQRIPEEGYSLYNSIAEIFKKLESEKKLNVTFDIAAQIFYSTAYGQALAFVAQGNNPVLKKNIQLTRNMCLRGLLKQGEWK